MTHLRGARNLEFAASAERGGGSNPAMRPDSISTAAPDALLGHAKLVRGLARALVVDEATVDDIAQDTWIAALERAPRRVESLGSWLGTVARRLALRRLRSDDNRAARERAAARPEGLGGEPESRARDLVLENVTRAVLDLEEPYRTVVILRYYEGLTTAEIARRTNAPLATVASRLSRAHARIRASLDRRTQGGRAAWCASLSLLGVTPSAFVMTSLLKPAACAAVIGIGVLVLWEGARALAPMRPTPRLDTGGVTATLAPPLQRIGEQGPSTPDAATRTAVPGDLDEGPAHPAAAPTTGSLRLRVVWDETGAPAPGRALRFFPWDALEPYVERLRRVTDARGEVWLEALPAGRVMFYGQLAGSGVVTIEAGLATEHVLRLPVGMTVSGRVVAPDGEGVAGARIWISDEMNDLAGEVVGEADADGRFWMEGLGPARAIAAFADDLAPAEPRAVDGRSGETVEITLELGAAGGRIHGLVVDGLGAPLPAAAEVRVRVEALDRANVRSQDGARARELASLEQSCDGTGRFELAGLPLQPVRWSVRARGYAPLTREVEPTPDGTWIHVALTPAGIVVGTIRDGSGTPLAGVRVSHGPIADFTSSFGRSRADGTYRLANLPAGTLELLAEHPDHGRAAVSLEVASGAPVEWSPTLVAGHALAGVVVDGDGAPRAGFVIDAVGSVPAPGSRRLWSAQVRTATDGTFEVASCPSEPLSLEVSAPDPYLTVKRLTGVQPGAGIVTIIVLEDDLPSARVRGTIVGADGLPLGANLILIGPAGTGGYHPGRCEAETGEFELGPLPPGEYSVTLQPDGLPPLAREKLTLARGEARDLGVWRLETPSRIQVSVEGCAGPGPFEELTLYRRSPSGKWSEPRRYRSDRWHELAAWPGTYAVQASGAEVCLETHELEIAAGEDARLELVPHEGSAHSIVITPGPTPIRWPLSVSIANERQQPAWSWMQPEASAGPLGFQCRLRAGQYTIVVRSIEGELARVPYSVSGANSANGAVGVPEVRVALE